MFGFGKKKDPEEAPAAGWLARLQQGLGKTRAQLGASLGSLFGAGRKLDEAFYEELETVLLTADVGVAATIHLLDALRARARRGRYTEAAQLRDGLREELCAMLEVIARPLETGSAKPFVIMLAGVNGAADCRAHLRLVGVDAGTVDVAVAELQRGGDGFCAVAKLRSAEADDGDVGAGGGESGDGWQCHECRVFP